MSFWSLLACLRSSNALSRSPKFVVIGSHGGGGMASPSLVKPRNRLLAMTSLTPAGASVSLGGTPRPGARSARNLGWPGPVSPSPPRDSPAAPPRPNQETRKPNHLLAVRKDLCWRNRRLKALLDCRGYRVGSGSAACPDRLACRFLLPCAEYHFVTHRRSSYSHQLAGLRPLILQPWSRYREIIKTLPVRLIRER